MIAIDQFINQFSSIFVNQKHLQPWKVVNNLTGILENLILNPVGDYNITNGVAIHKTAIIEKGVTFKDQIIISENCFVGANAYLRGPVYLGKAVKIGPGSEIKQCIIFDYSTVAHLNYIGNSIIGSFVNFEAGSICANHFNERANKLISVLFDNQIIKTDTEKFGSLVGDNSKIGANAVLSPGTILKMNSIVKRLELVDQLCGI